jgi:hypothetical protein
MLMNSYEYTFSKKQRDRQEARKVLGKYKAMMEPILARFEAMRKESAKLAETFPKTFDDEADRVKGEVNRIL